MITKLGVYTTDNLIPYENLAVEKYLTLHTQPGECVLFLWQNRRTVVIGKNQNCWKECKVNFLEEDGGYLARRLSGGGAVFHDLGNLNFTFCVRQEDYDLDRQLEVILQAVRLLGIYAQRSGRNDITVDGRKFSGNAFYRTDGYCYHHGTLMVDTDKENMSKYLNVSKEKLQTKGVESVKSRVVNLKECSPTLTMDFLKQKLVLAFELTYGLASAPYPEERLDWREIKRYENEFSSWEWKYGRKLSFQYQMNRRFAWGDAELHFQVDRGIVKEANAFSDSMEGELIAALPALLRGCRYEEQALCRAVRKAAKETEAQRQMAEDICALIRESI